MGDSVLSTTLCRVIVLTARLLRRGGGGGTRGLQPSDSKVRRRASSSPRLAAVRGVVRGSGCTMCGRVIGVKGGRGGGFGAGKPYSSRIKIVSSRGACWLRRGAL